MKLTQFQLASDTLTLAESPHLAFTERGLTFAKSITDAELLTIGHRLFAVRGYLNWAIGSFFSEMLTRRTNEKLTTDESWLLEFCETLRIDPKLRRECLEVFQFYSRAPADTPRLSYDHHREAYWGTCDGRPRQLQRAIAHLRAAQNDSLSVSELRRLIRSSSVTEHPDSTQTEFEGYGVVFEFRRFAARELPNLSSITPERASLLLSDIGDDALAFIDGLRAKAVSSHAKAV